MSCSQGICSSLVLSSKDTSDSLRQHCCLYFLFLTRELPLLGHVSLFWHLFAFLSTRTSLFFHLLMLHGHESFCRPSPEVLSDPSYSMVSQFLDLQLAVSDFTSNLDLFCHVIQSKLLLHVPPVLDP